MLSFSSNNYPRISYHYVHDTTYSDLKYVYWDGNNWRYETINGGVAAGEYSSITLDSSDNPHISFYASYYNFDLGYTYWDGSNWQVTFVDTDGDVGKWTSIALDSSDYPHISYYDETNGDLKYARWDGSNWLITAVDTALIVGEYTSIDLDSFDNPHISYYANTNCDLRYAYWDVSNWQISIVDDVNNVGQYSSIALDSNDYPHISYIDFSIHDLKYARWDGSTWQKSTVDEESINYGSSIVLDSFDHPHIAYCNSGGPGLRYAYWDGSNWQITAVDTDDYAGYYPSIALDTNDNPYISYHRAWDYLKIAWYGYDLDVELTSFTAKPDNSAITLHWHIQTTEGDQILGFNLYRRPLTTEGDDTYHRLTASEDQLWERVNPTLITGHNPYSYTDSDVEPGVAYEYKLKAVLADDSPETLGITQATAGQPTSFAILALYPNPASDYLTCLLAMPEAGPVELMLYDLSGRLVLEKRLEVTEPTELEAILDVSELASGIYTLRASSGGAQVSSRAVIAR